MTRPLPQKIGPTEGKWLRKAFWEFRPLFCLFPAQTRRPTLFDWALPSRAAQ